VSHDRDLRPKWHLGDDQAFSDPVEREDGDGDEAEYDAAGR